jgi:hypothetical protein
MTQNEATKLGKAAQTIIAAMEKQNTTLRGLAAKAALVLARTDSNDTRKRAAVQAYASARLRPSIRKAALALLPAEIPDQNASPAVWNRFIGAVESALPVGKPRTNAPTITIAPKTTRATRPAAAKAAPAPIERDNGDRLIKARAHWQDLKTAAHRLARVSTRNLTGAELRFIAAVRGLPSRAPNASSTLREWRNFATKVEAANLNLPR